MNFVVTHALQATPLLAAAALIDLLLPRSTSPRLRAWVWIIAALKLLIPAPASTAVGVLPRVEFDGEWMFGAWAWGAALVAMFIAARTRIALARLRHGAKRDAVLSARGLRVYRTDAIASPVLAGGALYWPAETDGISGAEQEQALRHELSHVRRRDGWRALAWSALVVGYWFHPLVWYAAYRMQAIREMCCDDDARREAGFDAEAYRTALARFALRAASQPLRPALAFADPRAPLTERLALLRETRRTWFIALCALLLLGCAWPVASWTRWVDRPEGSLQLKYMVLKETGR
jgi:beta-lactamase regulating signal transducer with metallopeptidase domain